MKKMRFFLITGVILLIPLLIMPAISAGVVLADRDIENQQIYAGTSTSVVLTVTSNQDGVQAPTLDENLPIGCNLIEIDEGTGIYKESTFECIWKTWLNNSESHTITYSIEVSPDTPSGTYTIGGFASAYNDAPSQIGGESTIEVINWVEIYDTNGTPGIQKDEAVTSINDYLMYEIINKQATILVLNGYFGV